MNKLMHNWQMKLGAFGLALLSWFVIHETTSHERVVGGVPLELDLPDGWAVKDQSFTEFEITFQGTQDDLLRLDARAIRLSADLQEAEYSSAKTLTLSEKNVSHTSNARIWGIEPNVVEVTFDQETQKIVPVNVNLQGDLQLGTRVESAVAEPTLVTITGPRESLDSVKALQTTAVDLTGRIQSFGQRVEVLPPAENWSGKVTPPSVVVNVTLVGMKEQRTFTKLPVRVMGDADEGRAWKRTPVEVDVILQGRSGKLDELKPSEIRAYVLPDGGSGTLPVLVHVPAGIDVIAVIPEKIAVEQVVGSVNNPAFPSNGTPP